MKADSREERLNEVVYRPLTHTSQAWYLWTAFLMLLIATGSVAYFTQIQKGLAVTGMRDTVIWGLYISNFVFFSGVSMSGTFISAILRITGAEWRRPLTRFAELTTVSALLMCGLMPIIDMGRPDRIPNLLLYGRLESPLLWDIIAITTYLTASAIYLYLFLIPDTALLRDRFAGKVSELRHRLYSALAMGWRGLPEQHKLLERGANIMMILIIPIGVTVHSVVSWIFGMTYRAGWASTIFAPYFAVGALYSGTAMLITLMVVFRKVYHLEEYLTEKHFRYMSFMLAVFGVGYLYFTFAEYLTIGYKLASEDKLLLEELLVGRYSTLVWAGFFGGQVLPILWVAFRRTRTIPILFVASLLVNIGMWVKRFIIVVPSLSLPLMPYEWGMYSPTWVEIAITAASFAGFALVFTLFTKLFPIVSVWEMKEGWERERAPQEAAAPSPKGLAARPAMLTPDAGGASHD
ncbi:MAG: polysulfide reductase NrfD [Chloroflexi bacterium]|nr:polysulfide reductase NrfD [Chloroflexota bacterium]